MTKQLTSQTRLVWRLVVYFAVLIGLIIAAVQTKSDLLQYLPLGGAHALGGVDTNDMYDSLPSALQQQAPVQNTSVLGVEAADNVSRIILFLIGHLGGTILVMIPITWTYSAVMYEVGYSKTFVRSLLVLPICATTTVLLIQDSLALAFGLAALVAALRFSIRLDEATDGVFIFCAVCVGLASGVGHVGIAAVMGAIFCFTNVILWRMDYGRNRLDDMRLAKRRAKLESQVPGRGA